MGRRRRLIVPTSKPQPTDRTYLHGLLHTYPCLAVRIKQRWMNPQARNPHIDGEQCYGQMRLQPVVAQRDDWQMLSYLCDRCGRVAWEPTYDARRSPPEQEPT